MKNKYLISTNPARGYEEVGRVLVSTPKEIAAAVKKAREALPAWRALSAKRRGAYFQKFLVLYRKRVANLAELQPKPWPHPPPTPGSPTSPPPSTKKLTNFKKN